MRKVNAMVGTLILLGAMLIVWDWDAGTFGIRTIVAAGLFCAAGLYWWKNRKA